MVKTLIIATVLRRRLPSRSSSCRNRENLANGAPWAGAPAATTASQVPIRRRKLFPKTDGARRAGARAAAIASAREISLQTRPANPANPAP
jgi:hypothetical protein